MTRTIVPSGSPCAQGSRADDPRSDKPHSPKKRDRTWIRVDKNGLALATVAPPLPAVADGPDAELIELGRQFWTAWDKELEAERVARRRKPDADLVLQYATAQLVSSRLAEQIEAVQARTLQGLRAKAFVVAWCFGFGPIDYRDGQDTMDCRMAGTIVRELLAMEGSTARDPHSAWLVDLTALLFIVNDKELSEEEDPGGVRLNRAFAEACAIYDRICSTPATTPAGMKAQLDAVLKWTANSTFEERERGALERAVVALDRLAGSAAHG